MRRRSLKVNYVIIHEMIMKSAEIELKYINLYMFGNILSSIFIHVSWIFLVLYVTKSRSAIINHVHLQKLI